MTSWGDNVVLCVKELCLTKMCVEGFWVKVLCGKELCVCDNVGVTELCVIELYVKVLCVKEWCKKIVCVCV